MNQSPKWPKAPSADDIMANDKALDDMAVISRYIASVQEPQAFVFASLWQRQEYQPAPPRLKQFLPAVEKQLWQQLLRGTQAQ